MAKRPKNSEVLMYGDHADTTPKRAEIISVGKDGKPIVEKGGFARDAAPERAKRPAPKATPEPTPMPEPTPEPTPEPPQAKARRPIVTSGAPRAVATPTSAPATSSPSASAPPPAPTAEKPAPKKAAGPPISALASAKAQSQALAVSTVNSLVDQLKTAANAKGGMLSVHDLDAMQGEFDAKTREVQAQIEKTMETFADARDHVKWSKERRDPFMRLLVKPFANLFQEKPGRKNVSRRMLPGLSMAVGMLLGPDTVAKHDERCRNIVARLQADANSEAFDWDIFYSDKDARTVGIDSQALIAAQFIDYEKRVEWFINLINSHLAAPPDTASEGEQRWTMSEAGFKRMMQGMLGNLQKMLSTEKGRERIAKRQGAETEAAARAALKKLFAR